MELFCTRGSGLTMLLGEVLSLGSSLSILKMAILLEGISLSPKQLLLRKGRSMCGRIPIRIAEGSVPASNLEADLQQDLLIELSTEKNNIWKKTRPIFMFQVRWSKMTPKKRLIESLLCILKRIWVPWLLKMVRTPIKIRLQESWHTTAKHITEVADIDKFIS